MAFDDKALCRDFRTKVRTMTQKAERAGETRTVEHVVQQTSSTQSTVKVLCSPTKGKGE